MGKMIRSETELEHLSRRFRDFPRGLFPNEKEQLLVLQAAELERLQTIVGLHKTRDGVPVHIGSELWDRCGPVCYIVTGVYADVCACKRQDATDKYISALVPWAYDSCREVAETLLEENKPGTIER
jgi:hypothetical protein